MQAVVVASLCLEHQEAVVPSLFAACTLACDTTDFQQRIKPPQGPRDRAFESPHLACDRRVRPVPLTTSRVRSH